MDALRTDLKTIDAALKQKPDLVNGELKGQLNAARGNLSVLARDGSKGAHNFAYATKVMDQAGNSLELVKAAMK